MLSVSKIYPRAHQNRLHGSDASLTAPRIKLLKAAAKNFLLLQFLFLGLFAYIFGSLFQQGGHTHKLNVLYVDYDGGVIGTAIRDAYHSLQADTFPTLQERTITQFPTPERLREEVCSTRYWAALYTSPGASSRLEAALSGSTEPYDGSDVMTYIWNEVRYSATVDAAIQTNLQTLSNTARLAYVSSNATGAVELLSSATPTSVNIFVNPWTLVSGNIQATTQGSRLIYNTLVIILILIQEFFYLGTINGLYAALKIYNKIYPHRIIAYRNMLSLSYTLIGALCVTGMIWAFRDGWDVNANQFVLSWMIFWLFAHSNFLWLDVFTIWLPAQYTPMALITWIAFNVTSILLPFELAPGFYRWAYAMPAHEVYQILNDIWSRGCNPQLHYALPIMFALELSGLVLSALGVYRRCHYAMIAEEAQDQAFRDHVDVALAFERKRDQEREQEKREEAQEAAQPDPDAEIRSEANDRVEIEEVIRRVNTEAERRKTRERKQDCNFGPSFDLTFKDD